MSGIRAWKTTAVYAAAHFVVDFGCAFAVFSACTPDGMGFLIYNFFAFAMQMPLGLLADRIGHNRLWAAAGAVLVAAMCSLPSFGSLGAAVLGLGNGLFHIGGGLDVLNLSGNRAAPLGVFVSPGAMGVYCGTLLGKLHASPLPVVLLLLAAAAAMLLCCRNCPENVPVKLPAFPVLPAALALFAVVILRSYGGMTAVFSWKTGIWSLAAVSATALGKAAGGFAADRLGAGPASIGSLALSAVLFCLSDNAWAGVCALLLFNMTMPITLWALAARMTGCKGFSFGILTFALFLGFLPSAMGAEAIGGWAMTGVSAVSAILLTPTVWSREVLPWKER